MNVTIAPAPAPAPAPQNHPHFNLGQIIGLALLGLQAYHQQDQPGADPSIFLNPANITPYLQGVLSLFPPPPQDPLK